MKFEDLDLLASLVETQSISLSARRMFLSNSTVSYRLNAMEKELGFPLFLHNKNRIALTSAGQYYYEQVKSLVDEYRKVVDQSKIINGQTKFVLGLPASFILRYKSVIESKFRNAFPKLMFDIKSYNFQDGIEPLLSFHVDYLITFHCRVRDMYKSIEVMDLFDRPYYCIVSERSSLADRSLIDPHDLKDVPFYSLNVLRASIEAFFNDCNENEVLSNIHYYDDVPVMIADLKKNNGACLTSYNTDSFTFPGCRYIPVCSNRKIHYVGIYRQDNKSYVSTWMNQAIKQLFI